MVVVLTVSPGSNQEIRWGRSVSPCTGDVWGLCAQNRIPPGSLVWAGAGSLPAPTFVLPYPPTLWVSIMEPPTTYCGFAAALAAAPL